MPTHHLDGGNIFLPPKEFLVLRSECSDEIVAVHNNVDKGVEESEEG